MGLLDLLTEINEIMVRKELSAFDQIIDLEKAIIEEMNEED